MAASLRYKFDEVQLSLHRSPTNGILFELGQPNVIKQLQSAAALPGAPQEGCFPSADALVSARTMLGRLANKGQRPSTAQAQLHQQARGSRCESAAQRGSQKRPPNALMCGYDSPFACRALHIAAAVLVTDSEAAGAVEEALRTSQRSLSGTGQPLGTREAPRP